MEQTLRRGLRMLISRMSGLRADRPGGSTVAVRFVATHEGFERDGIIDFRFESGRLVSAELDGEHSPDVIVGCDASAIMDYLFGAISVAEGIEAGRFTIDAGETAIQRAVDELDSDESGEALEKGMREVLTAAMAVRQSGAGEPMGGGMDFILRPEWTENQERQVGLILDEWERQTVPQGGSS